MFERTRSALKALIGIRQPGGRIYSAAVPTEAGVHVSEDSAMRFATVHACVRVISEDVAALPMHVYRRLENGGKERATDHPLYELLHDRPNPEMSAVAFKESLMVNALLTGNGYAFIEFDRAGRVKSLYPLLSGEVMPYRTANGELRYRAAGEDLRAAEVFHLPGLGFDGLMGMSPIAYARESIGLGMAAERYGEKFFRNGTHIGGVISVKDELSDDQFERLRNQFSGMFRGLQNAHGVPLLEGGATYTQLGIPPEDAQFLETRKYQRSEIAAIYRVPPHMIGDLERATFSNIEQQDLAYLQRTLLPWLMRTEQECRAKLLPDRERRQFSIEHDTANFMRGETSTRMQSYATAIMSGIMTPNEARRRENLNPVPGGDDIMLPLNMVQAGKTLPADAPEPTDRRALRFRHFIPGGERRAAGKSNIAAQLEWLGIKKALYDRLAEKFSAWMEKQADKIMQIAEEESSNGVRRQIRRKDNEAAPDRIRGRIASYYARLMDEDDEYGLEKGIAKGEFPEWRDLNDALADIAHETWEKVRAELGDAVQMNENWCKGYLYKYRRNMTVRLCQANYDTLDKALRNIPDEIAVDQLLASILHEWRRGEYATSARGVSMARTEAAFMRNEALIAAYRKSGYHSVWRSAPGCCRICTLMNGQTITTLKPPLHKGCGCTVALGALIQPRIPDRITIGGVQYSTKIRGTKQKEHVLGTAEYKNRAKQAAFPQSGFYSTVDIQKLVEEQIGHHDPKPLAYGGATEYFDAEEDIGEYFELMSNSMTRTRRVCIRYAKDGWHAFPTNPKP